MHGSDTSCVQFTRNKTSDFFYTEAGSPDFASLAISITIFNKNPVQQPCPSLTCRLGTYPQPQPSLLLRWQNSFLIVILHISGHQASSFCLITTFFVCLRHSGCAQQTFQHIIILSWRLPYHTHQCVECTSSHGCRSFLPDFDTE